ncbi:hypothetical protein FRC06_000137 [Ceratobasidium sp. 370]|nr:hypothetical protein FRC06_000137 [Ceratobasidium sp. 370]
MVGRIRDKHSTIWAAVEQSDKAAWGALDESKPSSDVIPLLPVVSTFNIDKFYKQLTQWIVTGNQVFTEIENEEL